MGGRTSWAVAITSIALSLGGSFAPVAWPELNKWTVFGHSVPSIIAVVSLMVAFTFIGGISLTAPLVYPWLPWKHFVPQWPVRRRRAGVAAPTPTAAPVRQHRIIRVDSEGFPWRWHSAAMTLNPYPLCPEHSVPLVFRYRQRGSEGWKTTDLSSWCAPKTQSTSLGGLYCPHGEGHDLGWFPDSADFSSAQTRAAALVQSEMST